MRKLLYGITFLFYLTSHAQTNSYKDLWQNIDSLEVAGMVASANEGTESLMQNAFSRKNYDQYIKAKIYHYRLYQINHEKSNQYILDDINAAIEKTPAPFKNLLESYKAEILMDYFRLNRWQLRNRSQIDDPDQNDIETWSLETLKDSIETAFENSLENEDLLIETSNSEISELLVENQINRKYQPSLFDLLSHRLLDYYSDSSFFTSEFEDHKFGFPKVKLFSLGAEFYDLSITEESSTSKALKQYQKLESLHAEKKETEPLIYWILERLKFVNNELNEASAHENFKASLQRLSEKYRDEKARAMIIFQLAYHYYQLSDEKNEKAKIKNPDYLTKSFQLIEQIISEFPNTISSQNAIRLKSKITAPALDSRIQSFLPSDEPGRIFLSYKNIDTLYYKILKVSRNFFKGIDYRKRDAHIRKEASRHMDSSKILLPGPKDFNMHSTEIPFNGRRTGSYLVYVYNTEGNFNYGLFQVTNLAVSNINLGSKSIFHVTNRKTGENLEDVQMQVKRYNEIFTTRNSDENGEISIDNLTSYRNNESISFIKQKDTLESSYNRYGRSYRSADTRLKGKVLFFLDRAIYRPGQKVYFKGILLMNENDSTATVPNEFIEVYVDDPNDKNIQEFRMKTNEYGSFTGSFTLPKGGITGQFSIYAEEDMDSETEFWNKIWDTDGFRYSYKAFSVEEYKRPSFEVAFDSVKTSFKLRDSVSMTGTARSYMGAAIKNATVKYEVKREKLIYSWWSRYYTNPVVIKSDSVTTDENGNFEIEFFAEADRTNLQDPDLIYKYSVDASVTDITGETRSSSKEIKIGNKNLIANIEAKKIVSPGDSLRISVKTTNLNDNKVAVTGNLKIFRLNGPDRILKERWWEAPEFNLMTKEEFHSLFPIEPYGDELSPEEWPKSDLVYQTEFDSDGNFEDQVEIQKNWKEGSYLIELEVKDEKNEERAKQILRITDPESQYLANNEQISVAISNRDRIKNDGFAQLKIQTAYKNLNLKVTAYTTGNNIFKKFIEVDGTAEIKIPVDKLEYPEFKLMITGVHDNSLIHHEEIVTFKTDVEPLQIETRTFRNKIQPGLDETWSFSVSDSKNKNLDAEVLASMYDASLDQFRSDNWETDAGLQNTYRSYPSFQFYNIGNINQLSDNFPYISRYHSMELSFDRLDLFGFEFGYQNSWSYRMYLENKKNEKKKKLEGNIKGRIVDENGEPLPGVIITIKNTSTGTQTNFDGEFAINAKKGDVLVISSLGFARLEYTVTDGTEIFLTLEEDAAALDEVVVTGYGVAEEAVEITGNETQMLLQGKVAGVQINETDSNTSIRIRGSASKSSGNPLFIIDGKPVDEKDLDPEDILSIEILKGSEATALYGSRAAEGVVIITTKSGASDLNKVEARKNLDETAFFLPDLRLGKDGKIEFSFTSPEALTSWKLRLLAHTKSWNTGKLQKTVVTQKDLNVVPNAPRFLREGDTLVFKAKISNLSEEAMTGNAVLKLFNAVTMQPIDSIMNNADNLRSFRMNSSNSEVVSWKLTVPDTIPAVTYRILANAGDFSDGEENLLPVLKNRMLVKESIPFFVRAGETENYVFENLKNRDSETLQNHQFTLEYSSNPAWYAIQSLPYLMEYEHDCSEQIFSRIFANSVGNKIVTSQPEIAAVFKEWEQDSSLVSNLEKNEELKSILRAETPWVMDAESESAQKKRVAELFNTEKIKRETRENLTKLFRMQNSSGAFPWFSGGRDNFYITRHIVNGFGHLEKLNVDIDSRRILSNAIRYLDNEFLERKKDRWYSEKEEDFYKSIFALYYLQTRSHYLEDFPLPAEQQKIARKIIEVQKDQWQQNSLHNKAILAMVLNSHGETDAAKQILTSLKETAVYSEDYGMYWKENEPSWYFSRTPVETQAMLIEAFSEVLNDEESVEEMKIWLLQNKRTNHWATTKSTTAASYALLMKGGNWLSIADSTLIKIGNEKIRSEKLSETKKEAGTGYLKINWDAEEINENFGNIEIENNNTTVGYGGAYWQYFEDLDKIKVHSESPLNIEKELYLNKAGKELQRISADTPLKTGDLVTVRLVVRTEADMDFVHLKDMRASGFEPTDVLSEYKYQDGTAYYQSTRDAATHFFFDSIRKGTYVLEYTVRANNAGDFSNGITLIESMYAPEFSGHTKGIRVQIKN